MKLRIRGNSIRLRLSQRDVHFFKEKGEITDSIRFGIQPEEKLTYGLEVADIKKLDCQFSNQTIKIFVPKELAKIWVETELVGMEHLAHSSQNTQLQILIEKDYKCLHLRVDEDETDSFPHPRA
ncbi:MAG TPA: hypothetical protein ENJ53_03200 [Phaeodactylibacter sp.]|nr:hypothetical protein [Phaeodactylibacter sp.]